MYLPLMFTVFLQALNRFLLLLFLSTFICFLSVGQPVSCGCPAAGDCKPCKGGITKLTLRYTGNSPALILIRDKKITYFLRILYPNEVFTVKGNRDQNRFETNTISFFINGILNTNIRVDCTKKPTINATFGDFIILSGESKDGGPLCCPPGDNGDHIPPTFVECPKDIIIELKNSECSHHATWPMPKATDNCSAVKINSNFPPGHLFESGTTTVAYTATDAANNASTCTFQVVVKDHIAPVIYNCPTDITVEADESGTAKIAWDLPDAEDNCHIDKINSNYLPGHSFAPGKTVVIYQAFDNSGNSATCTFNVIVETKELIHISKIVSPDGDGMNDVWILRDIEKYKENKVVVVDRWGGLLFSSNGYNNTSIAWDGTNQSGSLAAAGTYFYTIILKTGTSTIERKGFIELIR
jgi:gliding motility-associated-like protein